MRRVVVTGLGMVTPLGCGVETSWSNLLAGKSGAIRVSEFAVDDLACQIACVIPRGHEGRGQVRSRRVDGAEGEPQGRSSSSSTPWRPPTRRSTDAGWKPDAREDQIATGVLIGSGIGGLQGIEDAAIDAARSRAAPHQPVLHSGPADQSRRRPGVHPPQAQGTEQCRGHGLLDRRACHRRRVAPDRPRRRRGHGRRRHRIAGLPAVARRLRRLPGVVDGLQRPSDRGLASLRPRPRRLRHRRGRRRRGPGGARACSRARRTHLWRGRRLRHVRRRLSHHRAGRGRRRRRALHGGGA